jgi:hypothetical protein
LNSLPRSRPDIAISPAYANILAMVRWLRQVLVVCLAVALAASGLAPLSMAANLPTAQTDHAQDHQATMDAGHHLAMADDGVTMADLVSADATALCHGMAMPCAEEQPAVDHHAPACPNMMLCCIGAVPGVPAASLGLGAPMTAGAVLALALQRAGNGHIPSPLPKIPRA